MTDLDGDLLARIKRRPLSKESKTHIALAVFWALMLIPTLIWWKDSILYVALISVYALIGAHVSSFTASHNAAVDEATHLKLNAIAKALAEHMAIAALRLPAEDSSKVQEDIAELREVVGIENLE